MEPIQLDESLNIWTVADECSKEFTNISRYAWLVSMAKAIYSEPPQLLLRPDSTWNWKMPPQRRRTISSGISRPDWFTSGSYGTYRTESQRRHDRYLEQKLNPSSTVVEYDKDISKLKELTAKLTSTKEPARLGPQSYKEKIHREDFRSWCEANNHPLPRFWFPDEGFSISPESKASEILRQQQGTYATPREKREASRAVISAIESKIAKNEKYHQTTELRRYMSANDISRSKETGLLDKIKSDMRTKEIPIITGKAPKE